MILVIGIGLVFMALAMYITFLMTFDTIGEAIIPWMAITAVAGVVVTTIGVVIEVVETITS